jgi:Ca-activated chloride channel homolog
MFAVVHLNSMIKSLAIRRPLIISGLLLLAFFTHPHRIDSQTSLSAPQSATPYGLSISVDEVVLTFHALDAHGLAINDLKLDEMGLLDNGTSPRKILAFESLQNLPIRAGILMDTSDSLYPSLPANRAISIKYLQRMLRQQTDQAFVMDFAALSQVVQPWTNDMNALTAAIHKSPSYADSHVRGTAIFDAVYRACLNQFRHTDYAGSGNVVLLFSDGEDNASRSSLQDAVDMCQETHTAIYAFRTAPSPSFTGQKTLIDLASQSGGRVFRAQDSELGIDNDLQTIETDLRNQYRLVYKPAELKHDGSFHRIVLNGPERVDRVIVRSGYYAPGPSALR